MSREDVAGDAAGVVDVDGGDVEAVVVAAVVVEPHPWLDDGKGVRGTFSGYLGEMTRDYYFGRKASSLNPKILYKWKLCKRKNCVIGAHSKVFS